jgi:hypothetical protein
VQICIQAKLSLRREAIVEDDKKGCVIREVSKILEEEPCFEAVALSQDQRKLSIARLVLIMIIAWRIVSRGQYRRLCRIAVI